MQYTICAVKKNTQHPKNKKIEKYKKTYVGFFLTLTSVGSSLFGSCSEIGLSRTSISTSLIWFDCKKTIASIVGWCDGVGSHPAMHSSISACVLLCIFRLVQRTGSKSNWHM